MRILLLRPPRYLWPFNSETSAFWQPLGFLCLAATVRQEMADAEIQVWDAPGEKMGWQSLQARLADNPIDVLGVGEETVSAHEALRAARIVKQLYPECVVVAGGTYFANTIEETLELGEIDVIVRGEGERTFVELLRNLNDRDAWPWIHGLAFKNSANRIISTPPRELITNLDSLPFPAYDLVKMRLYGRNSHNHPALVSIEHSRGCTDSCNFCILWKQMGRSIGGNGQVRPCWRTKSAGRSFEEVRWLYNHFGRRTFGWVDPTFNVSPEWSDEWSELMLGSKLAEKKTPKTLHTAWLRADCIVRDEKLGVLQKLIRAGLRQVMIGIERDDTEGLTALNKHNNSYEICREAFAIFREKYPEVYTIGTVIFGLPGDTKEDIKRLLACQYKMAVDYCFVMPLTPNPGTAVAQEVLRRGFVMNKDLSSYNFHTPVCRTNTLSLRDLEAIYWRIMFNPAAGRFLRTFRTLFRERDHRKRRVHLALLKRGTGIALRSLIRRIIHPKSSEPALYSRRPLWYDK